MDGWCEGGKPKGLSYQIDAGSPVPSKAVDETETEGSQLHMHQSYENS